MTGTPFALVTPATRGLSRALTQHLLRNTSLPVYATYRSGKNDAVREDILSGIDTPGFDPARLTMLPLDLMSEDSIAAAARTLAEHLGRDSSGSTKGDDPYLHAGFFAGGVLYPERQPADLDVARMLETFHINTISHLLLIKHFSRFLPSPHASSARASAPPSPAKWVHVSARVGSISDNRLGGWYSYRASKAALNQIVKTFDLHLQARRIPAIAVGVHPGTVKTELSKQFWSGVQEGHLFEPKSAAEKVYSTVEGLDEGQRGRTWDWQGKEVPP